MIRDRLPDSVPWDPWCESRVLIAFLYRPDLIWSYPEIEDLLWGRDHRELWRAMRDLPQGLSPGDFSYALVEHISRRWPDKVDRLWRVFTEPYEVEVLHERKMNRALDRAQLRKNPYALKWADWIDRLQQCALARRTIEAAQYMAERAWRVDNTGACSAVDRWYTQRSTFKL